LDISAALSAGLSCLLVVAVAIGFARSLVSLTVYTARLAGLILALALFFPLLRRGTRTLFQRLGMQPPPAIETWLWRVMALAALVKLGGVLYPQIIIMDAPAHTRNVVRLLTGDWASVFLPSRDSMLGKTVGLEGGQLPYAAFYYLLSAPLTLLPIPLPLAMALWNGLLEIARNLLFYLLAVGITGRPRVGLWAAVFYTFLPAPYYLLSWGNYPTLLGLFAAVMVLVFLVLSYDQMGKRRTVRWWIVLLLFLIFSYLMIGVFTAALLLLLALLEWLFSRSEAQRRRAMAILVGLLLAEGLVFVFYHSGYARAFFRETLPAVARAVAVKSAAMGQRGVDTREGLLSNWVGNWTFVRNHLTDLGVIFACTGIGCLLIEPGRRRWRPLLVAWLLFFFLFSLVSGLVADMVLKHIFFMFPWFCLGAAVLAERFYRRGWAGRLVLILYIAWMVWLTLNRWLYLILVKRH